MRARKIDKRKREIQKMRLAWRCEELRLALAVLQQVSLHTLLRAVEHLRLHRPAHKLVCIAAPVPTPPPISESSN
eukprot:5102677-Prymnesium_polylepis.1